MLLFLLFALVIGIHAQDTNSTQVPEVPEVDVKDVPVCVGAGNATAGQLVILSPTISTVGIVNNPLNITWTFSVFTDTSKYPAKGISAFYAPTSKIIPKWVSAPVTCGQQYCIWTPKSVSDGEYYIKIVADDFDPTIKPGTCVPAGFPMPARTTFRIINSRPIEAFPNNYPANTSFANRSFSISFSLLLLVFLF